MCARMGPH
ncbi:hypothetical protein CFP56_043973 [Quercus suber]|uniref:Uncharacterized protein n=1 Tax=Quercus suber TaxID=58331 RepID=A0AAW0IQY4_QUESU